VGAEASYGIGKGRPGAAAELLHPGEAVDRGEAGYRPGAGEHSTWTFRYALRDTANAHAAFLAGKRRFPRFIKSRHRDRARFIVRDGLALVRELEDALGVRCCETQAHPRRTHPPLRRLRPGQ
jgi:putative transposase